MRRHRVAAAAACLAVSVAAGADRVPAYERPAGMAGADEPLIVAGYRALFACSARFVAGRPAEAIRDHEFVDVALPGYPDPVIDARRHLVTAGTPGDGPVMTAVYRDSMGCTVLPPTWSAADAGRLPYVELGDTPDLADVDFPVGDRVSLPAGGIDRRYRALGPVIDEAFTDPGFSDGPGSVTIAVLIVDDGRLIVERYRAGFGPHSGYRTWSTAKSLTAALIGIASGKGLIDPAEPAAIPEWAHPGDPRQAITHRHLLWMSSGLASGGNNTYAVYFGGQDVVSAVTSTPLETEPGTRWKYANNDTLLLLRALRHRLDDDLTYLRFPYDELFHRIGMFHTRMETDHAGNFVGSSQVYTTARDLARFGILLADDGVWQDQRILPAGWVGFVRTPAPTRPVSASAMGYGAQFWLLDTFDGVPHGTFTSAGNKGQYVTVVPDRKLVIVRTGINPDGVRWEQAEFVARIVAALGDTR